MSDWYSSIYKGSRDLLVYLPKDARENKDSLARYPVLYVLDGGAHFLSVAGMIKELAEFAGDMVLPKMIVVCVPSYNRNNELTPYPITANKLVPEEITKETGGAEKFTRFLETEVFKYIATKYPASNYRTLIGHSFGGIFALNVLAKHKNLFDNYIESYDVIFYTDPADVNIEDDGERSVDVGFRSDIIESFNHFILCFLQCAGIYGMGFSYPHCNLFVNVKIKFTHIVLFKLSLI